MPEIIRKILFVLLSLFFMSTMTATMVLAGSPPDAGHSTLSPNPSSVVADGSTTSSIQVTLHDSSGNALVGDSVSVIAPSDSAAVISPSSATTDSNGLATFTIHSTTVGTDSLNVVDNTTSTTLNSLGQVVFTSSSTPTPTPSCSDTVPSAPSLNNPTTSGTSGLTLTWTAPSTGSVSYYLVSYGIATGQYIYGNPNVGNVTSYTVGGLSSGKNYYFAIKAVNSCGTPGPYSNEVSNSPGAGSTSVAPITTNTTSDVSSQSVDDTPTDAPTDTPEVTPTDTPTPAPANAGGSIFDKLQGHEEAVGTVVIVLVALFLIISYAKPELKDKLLSKFKRKRRTRLSSDE
ncbi:MAG TPA: Ig-like domain-containing protein [Patescibacteria group bacterium]|nr:Ig-like domain-containing protein [Patescibacteria group bacterium]